MASFLVSSSHDDETFVKENRRFGGGAIVESVVSVAFFRPTYTSSSTTLHSNTRTCTSIHTKNISINKQFHGLH